MKRHIRAKQTGSFSFLFPSKDTVSVQPGDWQEEGTEVENNSPLPHTDHPLTPTPPAHLLVHSVGHDRSRLLLLGNTEGSDPQRNLCKEEAALCWVSVKNETCKYSFQVDYSSCIYGQINN